MKDLPAVESLAYVEPAKDEALDKKRTMLDQMIEFFVATDLDGSSRCTAGGCFVGAMDGIGVPKANGCILGWCLNVSCPNMPKPSGELQRVLCVLTARSASTCW